ncbi:Alpha/Beta hydrolase protein, partial [Trichophaea hybrida]
MSRFDVIPHITSASHIREFPRATTSGFISVPALKLAVNQYVPRGYTSSPGDLSIVFCHANGFHKELYEPFFDDLLLQLESIGVRVRGIWSLDAVNQGESGVLNEAVIGDQPCWNDLPRDVLHFINTFASHLPPPIFGIGHSYGGHAIVRTSLLHPSLFTAMIPIDPVIEE